MRRHLIPTALVLGGLVLAACGTSGPGVEARQTGDTTTTTTMPEPTTTTAPPDTTAPPPTVPPPTAAVAGPPCTPEALTAAYTARYGGLDGASLKVQKCVGGWATSAQTKGFDPPVFALYRAEGDHWVAINRGGGKLCEGHGVPPDITPQIGCDT
jgi:predicted small secreted protein